MHTGKRFRLVSTLRWSALDWALPLGWAAVVTTLYVTLDLSWLQIPWLPISMVGVAVAFYLGFKNNASYDRTWEARKIWGAIVNASRSWAFSSRDFVTGRWMEGRTADPREVLKIRHELVRRHIAWMDALRHQLRKLKSWEHQGRSYDRYREFIRPAEYDEDLKEVLAGHLGDEEAAEVMAQINPAAHLLSNQSRRLAELFDQGYIDDFRHMELQKLLIELMTQQGKAERIKNFPFPRQYATVNSYFAALLVGLIPFGLCREFSTISPDMPELVWLAIPFTSIVGWVFLTTSRIGEWSENPFEGLVNDVPITSMARGIERDMLQMAGIEELPPPREMQGVFQM
ncbi:MAG: bestrophin family protein [Bradymonadia bacterium]